MSTRHRIRHKRLGVDSGHSKSILRNLICSLVEHERIITTEAKARVLRPAAERMITLAKRGISRENSGESGARVHAYRLLMSRLAHNRPAVETIVGNLAPRFEDRDGGYTRMIKLGHRKIDSARMAVVEFVDLAEREA